MTGQGWSANRGFWQAAVVSLALHLVLVGALGLQWGLPGAVQGRQASAAAHLSAVLAGAQVALPMPGTATPADAVLVRKDAPEVVKNAAGPSPAADSPVAQEVSLATAGASAEAAEAGEGATTDPYADYLPAQDLDIIPMPVSAPDSRQLDGMTLDELQVGVRLYVDASGQVRQVAVDVPDEEQAAAQPLRTMFEKTAFVPGRKGGKAMASVLAIRIGIRDLSPIRRIANN